MIDAVKYARSICCKTIGIVCNYHTELGASADVEKDTADYIMKNQK